MNTELLTKIDKAPSSGQMLVYSRKFVKLDSYTSIDEVKGIINATKDVLEIHLFDSDKEYRALKSQSKRFASGWIEHIASHKEEDVLSVYADYTVLDDAEYKGMRMKVLNKVSYGETGMAYIDDYRLVMEEK